MRSFGRPRTLPTELVAREADDGKIITVLLLDVLVQLLEPAELGGEATLGGGVDNEDHLALVVGQGLLIATLWTKVQSQLRVLSWIPLLSFILSSPLLHWL